MAKTLHQEDHPFSTRMCPWSCVKKVLAPSSEIFAVINSTRAYGILPTLVDLTRIRATIGLSIAALKIAGDYVETGVFRGGTSVLMMRVLDRANDTTRLFWACDSFAGLPAADSYFDDPKQAPGASCIGRRNSSICIKAISQRLTKKGELSSSLSNFRHTVVKFHASLGRLRVVKGWFSDTLPPAGLRRIAFLRLDGDLYNSTYDALSRLEPLVAPGGYVYVDDYGSFRGCGAAVDRYLRETGLGSTLVLNALPNRNGKVQAIWWQKPRVPRVAISAQSSPRRLAVY